MAAPAIIAATAAKNPDLIRDAAVADYIQFIPAATDPQTFDPASAGGAVAPAVAWQERIWWYDSADTTTGHDGISCLILLTSRRYKTNDIRFEPDLLDRDLTTPPGSPTYGDQYLPAPGSTGAWAGHDGEPAIYTARGWQFRTPKIGDWFYVRDETAYIHYNASSAWADGLGSNLLSAASVRPSHLLVRAWAVENQTTNAPPGNRVTGASPFAPLGGAAENLNDDTTSTVCTATPGNLAAAALSARVIASLDFGSVQTLHTIVARQVACSSAASMPSACGLYYSSDGVTLTQAGAGFTISSTAADVTRTGSFSARYVYVVTSAENWGAITINVADLNAYTSAVVAAASTAWIIGPSPIGDWAGHTNKIAVSEAANTVTIVTPFVGEEIYDKAMGQKFRWTGTDWVSAAGAIIGFATSFAANGSLLELNSGASGYIYSATVAPTGSTWQTADLQGVTYAARRAGTVAEPNLIIEFEADVSYDYLWASGTPSGNITAALFRDVESVSLDWQLVASPHANGASTFVHVSITFTIPASDDAEHTYGVAFMNTGVDGSNRTKVSTMRRRRITIKEIG